METEKEYLDLTPEEQPADEMDVGEFDLNLEQVNLDLGESNINF